MKNGRKFCANDPICQLYDLRRAGTEKLSGNPGRFAPFWRNRVKFVCYPSTVPTETPLQPVVRAAESMGVQNLIGRSGLLLANSAVMERGADQDTATTGSQSGRNVTQISGPASAVEFGSEWSEFTTQIKDRRSGAVADVGEFKQNQAAHSAINGDFRPFHGCP